MVDSPEINAGLSDQLGLTFPIYSDPELELTRAYDVEEVGASIALPATFLVKEGGEVIFIYIGENLTDRPFVDEVLNQFDAAE